MRKKGNSGNLIDAFFSADGRRHYVAVSSSNIMTCAACGKKDVPGAELFLGSYTTKASLCDECLITLYQILQNCDSTVSAQTMHLIQNDADVKKECQCCSSKALDSYTLTIGNVSYVICSECLEKLKSSLKDHNSKNNPIQIRHDAEKQQRAKIQREKDIQKRQEEEAKQREDLKKVLTSDADLLYYDVLPPGQKETFILQKQSIVCTTDGYLHGSYDKPKTHPINKVVIKKAVPLTQCTVKVHPLEESKSKYLVHIPDSDFNVSFCAKCYQDFIKVVLKAMSDPDMIYTNIGNGINVIRKKHGTSPCHFCNNDTSTTIILNEEYIDICTDCMEALVVGMLKRAQEDSEMSDDEFLKAMTDEYAKALAEDQQAEENAVRAQLPLYDDRKMKCADSKTVLNIGYSRKAALKHPAEFVAHDMFIPTVCERIGHIPKKAANIVITTNRADDKFCLVLCKTCMSSLKKCLDTNGVYVPKGTPVYVNTHSWNDHDFCRFCGTSDIPGFEVQIGKARFFCCKSCKSKLSAALGSGTKKGED